MKNILLICLTALSTICFAQSNIEFEFKTGSDDLSHRDFQHDLEIRVILQGRADLILLNANKGQTWPNNSIRKVTMPLDATTTAEEIKEVHLYRKQIGGWNNMNATIADNWNLQKLTVTANIVKDGSTVKYSLFTAEGTRGKALFRFVYENKGPATDQEQGLAKFFKLNSPTLISGTADRPTVMLRVTIKTGGDDLRGGNDNVDISFKFKSVAPATVIRNLNGGRNWRNFFTKTVEKPLPPTFDIYDIESIDLRHTGGGGISADNWYLDMFKVTIIINGVEFIILDMTDTPIHYFTGDTRRKYFRELILPEKQ